MKNLIIIEYLTASPLKTGFIQREIFEEGLKMVDCLIKELIKRSKNTNIIVVRNENFKKLYKKNITYLVTSKRKNFINFLLKYCPKETEILLIAPESKGILKSVFKSIDDMGFNLLLSNYSLINKFSSKKSTITFLKKVGLPCVDFIGNLSKIDKSKEIILKPNQGAGSENIFILNNYFDLKKLLKKINFPYIIQYFKKGIVGSLNVIFIENRNILLSCNKHIVKITGQKIQQVGSIIGGLEEYRSDFQDLIDIINFKIKGFFGLVNFDVIRVKEAWKIIEINPRFSTTYCGLKEAYGEIMTDLISDIYLGRKDFENKIIPLKKTVKIKF